MWTSVAAELRGHLDGGLGGLLTEDVVRFATARALVAAGVDAAVLRVEAPHPVLKGSRVDLVVGRPSPVALIELKFPREPNEVNAAWTMALGEVLKDFYRLAAYPGEVDRVFVYVESDRLRRYMAGAARRYGVDLDTDTVALTPAGVAGLPATALGIIGPDLVRHHVTATRLVVVPVDDTLRLTVYHVDPLATPQTTDLSAGGPEATRPLPPVAAARQAVGTGTDTDAPPTAPAVRDGARREILDAVRAVLTRSGESTSRWPRSSARRPAGVPATPRARSAPWSPRTCAATPRPRRHHLRRPGTSRSRPLPAGLGLSCTRGWGRFVHTTRPLSA
ncbi:hypothetical protein ACQPYE_26640 [Actinosynnema sp. CA-299493]